MVRSNNTTATTAPVGIHCTLRRDLLKVARLQVINGSAPPMSCGFFVEYLLPSNGDTLHRLFLSACDRRHNVLFSPFVKRTPVSSLSSTPVQTFGERERVNHGQERIVYGSKDKGQKGTVH